MVMKDLDLSFFDIRMFLDDRGIPWSNEGKNISSGWIGLGCPFCGDKSNHGAINLSSLSYSCWKCSKKGTAITLVMQIDNCSFIRALKTAEKFVLTNFEHLIKKERIHSDLVIFPPGTSDVMLPIHRNFLIKRGYNPDYVARKYDLRFVGPTLDNWKFQLLIPVYMNQTLMTFVGRDTTGKAEIKYQNAPIERSILQAKHCLYGLDSVTDTIILVEGILDMWRIGSPAVCCFGTQITTEQINLIAQKRLKRCLILFDQDATDKAYVLASTLTSVVPVVEVLELDTEDPDSMTEDETWELRRELNI